MSAITDKILGEGLREYLHSIQEGKELPPLLSESINREKTSTQEKEVWTSPIRPKPTSLNNVVIKADLANETQKAYNLRVFLDPSKYEISFPFPPSIYTWFPKSCCQKIEGSYWEVRMNILHDNGMKSLDYLKKTLSTKYNYDQGELYSLNTLHFL